MQDMACTTALAAALLAEEAASPTLSLGWVQRLSIPLQQPCSLAFCILHRSCSLVLC